jgi:RNA polymerase primary sigma factor
MNKKRKEFEQVVGRTPSLPELAHELGLSLEKVNLYQHLSRNVMSLEMQLDQHSSKQDNRERTLGDRIPCTELPTPDEDAMSEAFRGEVHSMLDHLGDNERLVLTHRFGLEDGCPRTLRETSDSMGVSIDIVRGI